MIYLKHDNALSVCSGASSGTIRVIKLSGSELFLKQALAIAMQAKANGQKIWIKFDDSSSNCYCKEIMIKED